MARPAKFTQEVINTAQSIIEKTQDIKELRKGLSIVIPSEFGASNAHTAKILSVGVATVVRMQRDVRDQAEGVQKEKRPWGGRRRQHLSIDEEKDFLAAWVEKAEEGAVLVVPPIHAALEEKLGCPVAKSTVYRMLARHGWRKVEPDTCHPNRNKEAQEEFKENSKRYWRKHS